MLEIDGEALEHAGDLMRYLDELEPGDEVELAVLHGDDLRTLTATLGDRHDRAYLGLVPCGGLRKEIEIDVRVGVPGAVVVEVMPDSPAEEAGLQEGDVIVAIDGQELDAENNLADLIADYEPGDSVTLKIERPGEETFEVTVELGEHPDKEDAAYLGVRYSASPWFGGLEGLPFEEFEFDEPPFVFPEGEIEQGAIVRRVLEDSPASTAGLEEGDVITAIDGEPVESPRALADAIAECEPGDRVTLTVYQRDGEEEREIEVTLAEHPNEEEKAYLGVSIGGFFRIERHFEGDEPPHGFEYFQFQRPFDFDFDFELPFDRLELPFHLDEPRRFEFDWPPGEDRDRWPGSPGESI